MPKRFRKLELRTLGILLQIAIVLTGYNPLHWQTFHPPLQWDAHPCVGERERERQRGVGGRERWPVRMNEEEG
jgi:hypothetical protein